VAAHLKWCAGLAARGESSKERRLKNLAVLLMIGECATSAA
jgi:hypothetical protein